MRLFPFYFLILLTFSTQAKINRFIINGSELQPFQVPQMQTLQAVKWRCTATLIGPRTILTAAHCVEYQNAFEFEQTFGPTADNKFYKARMIRHPEFNPNRLVPNIPLDFAFKNDVALGILDRDVENLTPLTVTRRLPLIQEAVLYAGRGLPTYQRMWGQGRVTTLSGDGLTLRGFGQNMQVAHGGDSGGPNFIVDTETRELQVFAVTSTSTRQLDLTSKYNWPEALPFTQGISRLFPEPGPRMSFRDLNFIERTAQIEKLQICGLNLKCPPVTMD
ncbi:MAG: trypsin-like serine protease [Bdellovibrionales bacterium]